MSECRFYPCPGTPTACHHRLVELSMGGGLGREVRRGTHGHCIIYVYMYVYNMYVYISNISKNTHTQNLDNLVMLLNVVGL